MENAYVASYVQAISFFDGPAIYQSHITGTSQGK